MTESLRDLLVIVPSRGRPHNATRLITSMNDTCQGQTDLVIGLDEDDPAREGYPWDLYQEDPALRWFAIRSGLRRVTAWCNELALLHAGEYRFLGTVGDDNTFVTPGWDTAIVEALEETPFAFGNDQYPSRQPGTLSCHIFMRSEVVAKLGYFGPPSISHMYVDVAWYAWGTACGITYLHDMLIPHHHYTTGAPHDETYAGSFASTGTDLQAWHAYCRGGQLNEDIAKLGGTPFTDERLAKFNHDLNIPERWG